MAVPAPEWVVPQNTVFDRTVAFAPVWKVPDSLVVTGTTVEYATAAAPTTWVTTGLGAVSSYSPLGGGYQWASVTLAAGTIGSNQAVAWRVRYTATTFLGSETSAYSYLGTMAASVPASPTITAPAAAATVNRLVTTTWTTPENQALYEIEVRTATGGGGTVIYASTGTAAKTHVVTMDLTGVSRYIRIRYAREAQAAGLTPLWSAWVERQVTTAFVNPATPTFTTSLIDPTTLGFNHVVLFTITNPAPTGGQPTVTDMAIEYRKQGSSDPWVFIDTSIGMATPYRWRAPAGSWEFRVTSYATSAGTQATSAAGQPQTVVLKGVILELPTVPATYPSPMWLQYNDSGADEAYEVESALVQYQGRTYPVVEYGATKSNVIEVGKVTLLSRAEYDQLLAFVDVKTPVLYRDAKGRRVYGTINIGTIHDRAFGHELGFTISRIDYTNPIEVGQV